MARRQPTFKQRDGKTSGVLHMEFALESTGESKVSEELNQLVDLCDPWFRARHFGRKLDSLSGRFSRGAKARKGRLSQLGFAQVALTLYFQACVRHGGLEWVALVDVGFYSCLSTGGCDRRGLVLLAHRVALQTKKKKSLMGREYVVQVLPVSRFFFLRFCLLACLQGIVQSICTSNGEDY